MAAALDFGPAVPLGYDSGLHSDEGNDLLDLDPASLAPVSMTRESNAGPYTGPWSAEYPSFDDFTASFLWEPATTARTATASDSRQLPGRAILYRQQPSLVIPSGGSSSSPAASSHILTPASTTHKDYHGDQIIACDELQTTPADAYSFVSPGSINTHLSPEGSASVDAFNDLSQSIGNMTDQRTTRSDDDDSSHAANTAGTSPLALRTFSESLIADLQSQPWSAYVPPSTLGWTDQMYQQVDFSDSFNSATTFSPHNDFAATSSGATFPASIPHSHYPMLQSHYVHQRPVQENNMGLVPSTFQSGYTHNMLLGVSPGHHAVQPSSNQRQQSMTQQLAQPYSPSVVTTSTMQTSSAETVLPYTNSPAVQEAMQSLRQPSIRPAMSSDPHQLAPTEHVRPRQVHGSSRNFTSLQHIGTSATALGTNCDHELEVRSSSSAQPLQPAASVLTHGRLSAVQKQRSRKGGRAKDSHLPDRTRAQSHKMRQVGACWRCKIQRDPCSDGSFPCQRCYDSELKGQQYYFPCDRSKLPDLIFDFLPPSMTFMHQKQSIEDCVSHEVRMWDETNPIIIQLTSGYGPSLEWTVYEFQPRSQQYLGQLQYLQNTQTGVSERRQKYSPPLGLLRLETSDDKRFDEYLDTLMHPDHLVDLGDACFQEESYIDDFQATLLELLCELYLRAEISSLKTHLRDIIRMMIITYIMSHTLTLEEETVPSILSSVRHSRHPTTPQQHTSPRLANRQLKFFFCMLRNNMYAKLLNWQQQTLHASKGKESTWLPAFCAMLGFAMVLEEVQRTIHIQADAKSERREMSSEAAETEALNACQRIDTRFQLLVGLFQCKYRDKNWGSNGTFANATPEIHTPVEREYLVAMRELVQKKQQHLQSRKDVPLGAQNQCQYTSRLVARFLLPFLGLPP